MTASLGNIRSIFAENQNLADGLKQFLLKLVSQATEDIGWEFKADEDYLTGQLRALLIGAAGGAGHPAYDHKYSIFRRTGLTFDSAPLKRPNDDSSATYLANEKPSTRTCACQYSRSTWHKGAKKLTTL